MSDTTIYDFEALSIEGKPAHLSTQRGKVILVETFKDLLPASIQTRSKMGFGIPIAHWFRNELRSLVRDTLLSQSARVILAWRPCITNNAG